MPKTFELKILTPDAVVLNETVEQLVTQTKDGEIGILPDHIPLITPLIPTALKYWKDGEMNVACVLGGMMEVSKNNVTIISDHAALEADIDKIIAEKEKELEEAKKTHRKETVDIQKAEMDLHSLLINLKAVQELTRKLRK